jgi:hypothetical protein
MGRAFAAGVHTLNPADETSRGAARSVASKGNAVGAVLPRRKTEGPTWRKT